MRRPRILITTTVPNTLSFMRGFPEYLAKQGWDVHVVSSPGETLDAFKSENVIPHELPMDREPSPRDARALVNWIKILSTLRPDIVFATTPKASFLSMMVSRVKGIPARCYAVVGLRLEGAQGISRSVLWLAERITHGCASHILVNSQSLRQKLVDLHLTRKDIDMIGAGSFFGVEFEHFDHPPKRELSKEGPVIGYVGRIHPDKGIRELVQAFQQVRQAYPTARLLIVGRDEGAENYFADLPADAIEFAGFVSDPAPYFRQMDVLAFPTYREGFPVVVIEAQASGVPVVATDATGACDAIAQGQTGIMVPVRDAYTLAQGIQSVLDDALLRHDLQDRGQNWARTFSRHTMWRQYDAYLRDALRSARRR